MKASIRRESQQRRIKEKQHQRGLSASYLEPDRYDDEEEGEESISLAAIKNKYKGGRGKFAFVRYTVVTCLFSIRKTCNLCQENKLRCAFTVGCTFP